VVLSNTGTIGQRIDASRDVMRRLGFHPDAHRLLYVESIDVERVPVEPTVQPLPLFQLSRQGRERWPTKVPAFADGVYLLRRFDRRSTAAWPATRGQFGGNYPREGGESWEELTAAGLNPTQFFVSRGADAYFEPFVPPIPADQATYPDPALAHLPLYRVTGNQDSILVEQHRDKLFHGVFSNETEPDRLSILVPTDSSYATDGLGFMYEPSTESLRKAGIDRTQRRLFRQYNIRANRYEEVTPGSPAPTVEVTAVPVEKMGKKALRAALEAEKAAHVADMAKVSARLEAEAISRDWCDTYDRVVRDVNADLAVPLIPRRPKVRKSVAFQVTTPRTERLEMHADATPEEVEAQVQAWVKRNVHAGAEVSNITVT
jgi:hypothetical protein